MTKQSDWRGRPASESRLRRRWPDAPDWKHAADTRQRAASRPPRRRGCATSSASPSTASGRFTRSATSSSGSVARLPPSSITRPRSTLCARRNRRRRPLAGAGARRRAPAPRARRGRWRWSLSISSPRARAKGQPWALARAARCLGLLAQAEELDAHFEEALRLHGEHRMSSRPPAPGWHTVAPCVVRASAHAHANSCERQPGPSSASARRPGSSRQTQSLRPPARWRDGAT